MKFCAHKNSFTFAILSERPCTAAAKSIRPGATAGSDALFSDDESAESSHPEDEESDAGKADEQWAEGFTFNEE